MRLFSNPRTIWYIFKYQIILRKAVFGRGTLIKCKLRITGPGKITTGTNCIFEADPWGDDYVTVYTHRKRAVVTIGNNVILRATRIGSHLSINIGNNCLIENASVYDSDFHNVDATKRNENFNEGDRLVDIGDNCYVGCESLCSKGTILTHNVIMRPLSVIGTKKIPADSIVGGIPARIVKAEAIS